MSHNFTALYEAAARLIQTNDNAYNETSIRYRGYESTKDYTDEEVERILKRGSITEQQNLSRYYFQKDTFYKRIILHYATLLKYCGNKYFAFSFCNIITLQTSLNPLN